VVAQLVRRGREEQRAAVPPERRRGCGRARRARRVRGALAGVRGGRRAPCAPPDTPTPGGAHTAVAGRAATLSPTAWWNSFEALPRYHNSYVGLRNRFALLSEPYAYATFEDRIKATNYLHGRVAELRDDERA
jgi:hypothetical protein